MDMFMNLLKIKKMEATTNRDIYIETHTTIDKDGNELYYNYVDYIHEPNRKYERHRDSTDVLLSIRNGNGDWMQTRMLGTATTKEEFANVVGKWFYAEW